MDKTFTDLFTFVDATTAAIDAAAPSPFSVDAGDVRDLLDIACAVDPDELESRHGRTAAQVDSLRLMRRLKAGGYDSPCIALCSRVRTIVDISGPTEALDAQFALSVLGLCIMAPPGGNEVRGHFYALGLDASQVGL